MKLSEETFEKEIAICKKQFAKRAGCNWGKCEQCGVVPLLLKLYKNELVENTKEVEEIKRRFLSNSLPN